MVLFIILKVWNSYHDIEEFRSVYKWVQQLIAESQMDRGLPYDDLRRILAFEMVRFEWCQSLNRITFLRHVLERANEFHTIEQIRIAFHYSMIATLVTAIIAEERDRVIS